MDILSMVDLTSISAMLAAIGVSVGVFFAILELRNLVKTRQTDIVMRIYTTFSSNEYQEAWEKVRDRKTMSYIDYRKKYGLVEANQICSLYNGVGVLLRRKLVDVGLVQDLFGSDSKRLWNMFKPLIEEARRKFNVPDMYYSFEYLYNEIQKREQQIAKT